ncbi:NitT/TauT family transport system substrate-binding protein [Stella humosa]|uniref:NitT/TauT family transport system substrate-binding protein n=1 Tax=Stella humosa TaxID=94 RepID=A0A3N1MBT5_9PROT|nr:ABC transporter substrate-binding protein [Stella humosa]ROQ00220.1 NitT/TauT family transport system substrate-binding protein [Stella humosa]BBK30545.1 ABC transporter substrate-binding protein [Stella humosa]
MLDKRLGRRQVLQSTAALVGAGALGSAWTGPLFAQGKLEKPKVTLAVGGKSALYYLALTIAEQKGFFKDEGLDLEINDFAGGSRSLQALVGGSADVVAGAYEHTIRMQARGQEVQSFALIGRGMQIAIGIKADRADKVKSAADVKGMKFGVTAPGSSTHMLLIYWIAKAGLKATDVAAIGTGAGASVVAAVDKGEIDGVSQTDPVVTMLEQQGAIKVVVDTRTMKGNMDVFGGALPAASLYSTSDFVKANPNTVQALANAIVRANQWLQKATPDQVADTVPAGYLLGDRELYKKAFVNVKDVMSPDGLMPDNAPETCLKFLTTSDPAIKGDTIKLGLTWTNDFAKKANEKHKA